MSKLSDIGLLLFIIGTFLSVFSIISSFNVSLILFLYLQIISGIFIAIASIFIIITKEEYHIIKLKNDFPLKLDHLIIFACAMSILISFSIAFDINSYKYTGKVTTTYFAILFLLFMFVFAILKRHFKKQKENKK